VTEPPPSRASSLPQGTRGLIKNQIGYKAASCRYCEVTAPLQHSVQACRPYPLQPMRQKP
jgi:hypothetical protein